MKKVEAGNVICELTDILGTVADCRLYGYGNFELIDHSWQRVSMKDAAGTVESIIRTNTGGGAVRYHNKDVVALNDEGDHNCDIQVIYGKDDHEMGLMTLRRFT